MILYCHNLTPHYDFLDSGSYIMDGIIGLNDHIMYYELILLVLVVWMMILILVKNINQNFVLNDFFHGSIIEIIWTLIPSIILILIAIPSFRLLYLMDDYYDTSLSIKVMGNQWYWSYSYDNETFFDSYMSQELIPGSFRLLDTDEHLILPSNTPIRFLISSTDVIHSWSIPSLGIKMDAIPGKLNQIGLEIYRSGLYFGMCQELCGINHAFMPITLKVI
jgi:cytochrome c oxidase subunit 2